MARWESQLKPRCAEVRLRDFRVLPAQQVIDGIHRQNPEMKLSTLAHLKNLLSLIFDDAERLELLAKGAGNPVKLVRLPDAPEAIDTYAYSLTDQTLWRHANSSIYRHCVRSAVQPGW